jgi:hypothetical protein
VDGVDGIQRHRRLAPLAGGGGGYPLLTARVVLRFLFVNFDQLGDVVGGAQHFLFLERAHQRRYF